MEKGAKPDHSARGKGSAPGRALTFPALWILLNAFLPATMTSRRIISSDKNLFDKDETLNTPNPSEKSAITPAVPAWVNLPLLNR